MGFLTGSDAYAVLAHTPHQPWTVQEGKVLSLTGDWWTPAELLDQVKAYVLAYPDRYDQQQTICVVDPKADLAKGCGMVACLGGWALLLTTGRDMDFTKVGNFITNGRTGWPWLFDADFESGPEGLAGELFEATMSGSHKAEALVAAKAIELFQADMANGGYVDYDHDDPDDDPDDDCDCDGCRAEREILTTGLDPEA